MKTKLPLFCLCTIAFGLPSQGQVAMAGSYLNTSQLTGGQVATGDILEIRAVISVPSGTVYTKVSYSDVVPAGTSFVTGSLKAVTNEGVIVGAIANTGTYTDAADADRGKIAGSNITINMGDGASSATGGTITGATTKPLFYNSASILMAAYRVKV